MGKKLLTEQYEKLYVWQMEWIKLADAKIPSLSAINIAMLGAVGVFSKDYCLWSTHATSMVVVTFSCLAMSCFQLSFAVFPRTEPLTKSNVYFGSIAQQTREEFIASISAMTVEQMDADLKKQIHINAKIAMAKHTHVQSAIKWLYVGSPSWLISMFLISASEI